MRAFGKFFILGGIVLVVLALIGLFLLRGAGDRPAAANRQLPPTVGTTLPDFELIGIDDTVHLLSDYQGKKVIINFWATWCPPCVEEMPLLQAYAQKYTGELVVLGVNSMETLDNVRPFIEEMGITFPILLDEAGLVSDRYFVKDYPYTFFVDESGVLRAQHIGLLSEERLVRYLRTIGLEP